MFGQVLIGCLFVGPAVAVESQDCAAIAFRPGSEPVRYRRVEMVTLGSVDSVEVPGGKIEFSMKLDAEGTYRMEPAVDPIADAAADWALVRLVYETMKGKIATPLMPIVEFDSEAGDDPVFPPIVGLQARQILAFSGGRSLSVGVGHDGRVRVVDGFEELLGEELLDDLGPLGDALLSGTIVDETQLAFALLPLGAVEVGSSWNHSLSIVSPSPDVPSVPITVTGTLDEVDAASGEATISYVGAAQPDVLGEDSIEPPSLFGPDGRPLSLAELDVKSFISSTRIRDISYLGRARVDLATGVPRSLEWDQSITVSMPSPFGKPLEIQLSRRIVIEHLAPAKK